MRALAIALVAALALASPASAADRLERVIDGDTFVLVGGERIRIVDIDTPERGGRAKCPYERGLAEIATRRLDLALRLEEWRLSRVGKDRFGRTLALVVMTASGRSIGDRMVSDGVAVPWAGRRNAWCK